MNYHRFLMISFLGLALVFILDILGLIGLILITLFLPEVSKEFILSTPENLQIFVGIIIVISLSTFGIIVYHVMKLITSTIDKIVEKTVKL